MGREEGRIFPYCSSGHECMCVRAHVQFCLRSYGTRLVCGFLRGKQRLMRTRLCLLTDYSALFGEQDAEKKLNKCCDPWNKKEKKKRKKRKRKHLCCFGESQKHLLVNKPRAETLGTTLGKKADTFGQISQVEPSKAVSARTRRCGRKDHLETSCDICLSVNYSNKHAREWHLILDVSPEGTALDASNSNKELRYTNTTENKHSVHCTLSCVRWDAGLVGCKVGQRLIAVFSNVGRRAVIMRSGKNRVLL